MKSDYRNTPYCSKLDALAEKKKQLNEQIYADHPRVKIIYNQVKDKNGIYKSKFIEIYNYKCSYCGNSIFNISSNLFEVDHYICESSFASKEDAGKIENLVLACYDCNRSKSGFLIDEEYLHILNPDLDNITDVFCRDDMYYIKISEQYKDDKFIKSFYDQLKFGYQSRRLDYLLMNIRGLCKKLEGSSQAEKLNTIINKLQYKRNLTNC
jgi:5-methylcytosine-specific restriction endonuclease McrA